MIEYKTAVLLGAAMQMGAIVAEASDACKVHSYEFGRNLGIAFQLQDDYLDCFGDPEKFGKQVGGDIISNKKTYLYLTALVNCNEIDKSQVAKVAKIANLDNFINTLPERYDTFVGERGVRLSGGQQQRIGIARALYHDPDIIMLDEATSSLDSITENSIMEAIHNIAHQKTIIMIAHRLSTIKECDEIHMMDHGRIVDSGTYEHLISFNKEFKKMTTGAF